MPGEKTPVLIDLPMPIRTPRLLLRPRQPGDEAVAAAAIAETWADLHHWMAWAEDPKDHTPAKQELRTRRCMEAFALREEITLIGREIATGEPVVWTGFHEIDWQARRCETGFWVRKKAQNLGFATEATNALLRYAFGALGMRCVGITHSAGNDASRRIIQKLGFTPQGVLNRANHLPGNRIADRHCYSRLDLTGLPPLDVQWGEH